MANFKELRTPFTNMSFTPDQPSAALGANEYNSGYNVETDIRGIRSVSGDELILSQIPGKIIFVTSGYRANNVFWFIVATSVGKWYGIDEAGYTEVTPPGGLSGYTDGTPITSCWNGTTLFINDSLHPPMFLTASGTTFTQYSDNGTGPYVWNYSQGAPLNWVALRAGWMRLYCTPNVGSILIAGNLTADNASGITNNYPTTVQWSQAFGLNDAPATWAPTTTNIANQLEVPVRGPTVDGFPMGGNFYVCSYWDTVVFSPINYQGTLTPVLGVRLLNQGRGLLNENCWANADTLVYGLDARDIWSFDGSNFKSLGNQRVKDYFYQNLNQEYVNRVNVINNTQKNQIEIYYPDLDSPDGWCNKMLSYRYDLDIFNPPRDVRSEVLATEAPIYNGNTFQDGTRTVVYCSGIANTQLCQKDQGYTFINSAGNSVPIESQFRRDNITLGQPYSNKMLIHRILPEVINLDGHGLPSSAVGNVTVTIGGSNSVGQTPTFKTPVTISVNTNYPWTQISQNAYRINSIELTNTSSTDTWLCSAVNWQYTPTEDDR